ncbi:unnamed protein product [Prorocentrum cordatum]|uniref:Uncharacterized protein n=1 Tax=Prorocentrum cordatum TaxID=2364126 RepID=A0ABN9T5I2_9DINO|nr:unnamed protein product [Polarella glacialis]
MASSSSAGLPSTAARNNLASLPVAAPSAGYGVESHPSHLLRRLLDQDRWFCERCGGATTELIAAKLQEPCCGHTACSSGHYRLEGWLRQAAKEGGAGQRATPHETYADGELRGQIASPAAVLLEPSAGSPPPETQPPVVICADGELRCQSAKSMSVLLEPAAGARRHCSPSHGQGFAQGQNANPEAVLLEPPAAFPELPAGPALARSDEQVRRARTDEEQQQEAQRLLQTAARLANTSVQPQHDTVQYDTQAEDLDVAEAEAARARAMLEVEREKAAVQRGERHAAKRQLDCLQVLWGLHLALIQGVVQAVKPVLRPPRRPAQLRCRQRKTAVPQRRQAAAARGGIKVEGQASASSWAVSTQFSEQYKNDMACDYTTSNVRRTLDDKHPDNKRENAVMHEDANPVDELLWCPSRMTPTSAAAAPASADCEAGGRARAAPLATRCDRALSGPDADLWSELGAASGRRARSTVTVEHVNSHLTVEGADARCILGAVLQGNTTADVLAEIAAARCRVGASDRGRVASVEVMAGQVRWRLLRSTLDAVAGERPGRPKREQRARVAEWLRSPCHGFAAVAAVLAVVQIGGGAVHRSHRVVLHRELDVWFCQGYGFLSLLHARAAPGARARLADAAESAFEAKDPGAAVRHGPVGVGRKRERRAPGAEGEVARSTLREATSAYDFWSAAVCGAYAVNKIGAWGVSVHSVGT